LRRASSHDSTEHPDSITQQAAEPGAPVSPDPSWVAQISSQDLNDPHRKAVPKFAAFAWIVLVYNLAAVAWGVFVRASKSGDGCGSHWPLCDGNSDPLNGPIARIIESSHRISTALCGVFVIAMLVMAIKNFPKRHQARIASWVAFGFVLLEGGIGWALVKFQLVTENDSAARAGIMSFHVVSTFLLLSAIAMAAMAATGSGRLKLRGQGGLAATLGVGFLGIVVLGVSGAISALGHTLMPVKNVLEVASNPDTFWMVRLQPLHPYLSLAVGLYLALVAGLAIHLRPSSLVRKSFLIMLVTFGGQLLIGLLNIQLMAPIWMQMIHLVLGDIVFVSLVVAAAGALLESTPRREGHMDPAERVGFNTWGERFDAYVALTKPRVISLLIFTAGAAMFAAKPGWPGLIPFLAVMVGGYFSAGAANTMNMVVDRDIDGRMNRTSTRPTVTQSISTSAALNFSLLLTLGSFAVLWAGANLLAAMIALFGQTFYVCVYTLILKRRTWQNIVIGGAAGSVPPMVGWVAVTGSLNAMAWWMFALIFLWTPVHFWALALLLKDDYQEAGVPMLPVVKGERATVAQISFYTALTVALSLLPFFAGMAGLIFLISTIVLDVILVRFCARLARHTERPQASALFHYSMLYLAALFLMFAVDQRWIFGSL